MLYSQADPQIAHTHTLKPCLANEVKKELYEVLGEEQEGAG